MKKMRQLLVILFLLTVSTAHDGISNALSDDSRLDANEKTRIKRQNDQWDWGTTGNENGQPARQTSSDSVCAPYNPPVPDFRAPGRRKSEVKCYEFIWGIKLRNDRAKRHTECENYLRKNGTLPRYHPEVIGGHFTSPGEYPHMGAIGWKASVGTWVFKCGGSLISDKFVLTAAHCSQASPRDTSIADVTPKIVRLGDKNIIDVSYNNLGPRDANIQRVIVHPKYKPPKKYYDIALMELQKSVEFDVFVQPACLWAKPDLHGLTSATVTGWGVVESGGRTTSPELQAASVDIIDSRQCDGLLRPSCNRHWCGLQDNQVCAGKLAGGVDACQGDSGGPLQVKLPLPVQDQSTMHTVIGVTSFGIGCAMPNLPGIYTRVSSFLGWIEDIVWP